MITNSRACTATRPYQARSPTQRTLTELDGALAPTDVDELQRKVTRLEQQNVELTAQVEEARSDLAAAREANRDLTRALNQRG